MTVLICFLLVSLASNVYFYLKDAQEAGRPMHHSSFFSFVIGPSMQNMTRGNLYLNLTFDVVEGNITVKAEINTDSYNPDAFLALQFDSDANGTIDIRYWPEDGSYYYDFEHDDFQFLLRANNHTSPSMDAYWGWLPDGAVYFGRVLPSPYPKQIESPFHTCAYSEGIYTFSFTFSADSAVPNLGWPYGWLHASHGIRGKLVRALYGVEPSLDISFAKKGMTAYVPPFNFMG
jgi:hypothetical protein